MKMILVLICMCMFLKESVLQSNSMECQQEISNICYEDDSYPTEEISKTLNNVNMNTRMAFGKLRKGETTTEGLFESCKLCQTSKSMRIQPLSYITGKEKLYIIGSDNYPRPEIDIRICKGGSVCKIEELYNDYRTRCVQKMTKINVLTFNSTSKQFVGFPMPYPSSCECVIEPDD